MSDIGELPNLPRHNGSTGSKTFQEGPTLYTDATIQECDRRLGRTILHAWMLLIAAAFTSSSVFFRDTLDMQVNARIKQQTYMAQNAVIFDSDPRFLIRSYFPSPVLRIRCLMVASLTTFVATLSIAHFLRGKLRAYSSSNRSLRDPANLQSLIRWHIDDAYNPLSILLQSGLMLVSIAACEIMRLLVRNDLAFPRFIRQTFVTFATFMMMILLWLFVVMWKSVIFSSRHDGCENQTSQYSAEHGPGEVRHSEPGE